MRGYRALRYDKGIFNPPPTGGPSASLCPQNLHLRYTRDCDKTPISDETVVAHCLTTKEAYDKRKWMKSMGLWLKGQEQLLPRYGGVLVRGDDLPYSAAVAYYNSLRQ